MQWVNYTTRRNLNIIHPLRSTMFVLVWQKVTSVLLGNDAMSLAKIFLGHFSTAEVGHSQTSKSDYWVM